jgi:hypothetical protein
MKRTNKILDAVRYAARNRYAWPGGYPLFVAMADGGCLCPSCTRKQWRQIVRNTLAPCRYDLDWQAIGADANWENPDLYCAHCGVRIESAYAEE